MTISVKDATGATQTIRTNDDIVGTAGAPDADVLTVQGISGGTPLNVTSSPGTYVEKSGTITTGGTAQTLAAANATRRFYRVMNLSTADLWINDKGVAAVANQPSFKLVPGAMYETLSCAPTAAISIFGATTGQAFSACEA